MPKQVLIGETNDVLISMMGVRKTVWLVKCKVFRMLEVANIAWVSFPPLHELEINPLGPVPRTPYDDTPMSSLTLGADNGDFLIEEP